MKSYLSIAVLLLFAFTVEARAEDREVLKVGVRTGAPPFCFLSKKDGKVGLRGINVDLITQIERLLRVKVRYSNCNSIEQRREWLARGRIDVIAIDLMGAANRSDIDYVPVDFSLTRRFFVHEKCKTVVCSRDLSGKKVVVLAGDNYRPFVQRVEESNLFVVRTSLEALLLLDRDLVDAFLAPSELVAQYLIQTEKLRHIVRVGMALEKIPLALGVRADDHKLFEELTTAVARLRRTGTLKLIKDKWYGIAYQPTSWRKYSKAIIIGISSILVVFLTIFAWSFQLKRKVLKVTKDLQTSERKYRSLIESSPDMIFVVEEDGRIEGANKRARVFMAAKALEKNEKCNLVDLVTAEEKAGLEGFLSTVFNRESGAGEFQLIDGRGQVRDIDIAATLIPGETSCGSLACCIARDVSDRNRIEKELVQADRLATIGKMAAGVAHEINNPLGIMRTNIELILARGWFSEEAKEFVDSIQRNTVRAGKITQDLLALGKPKTPEMGDVNLSQLVEMTLSLLGHQLKGIDIEFHLAPEPVWVWGDRNLLQQVLVNVFLNARAALEDSRNRKIRISFCAPPGEDAACLRIGDNGKGIPRKNLNEVFESFFTDGKQEGFGLGLFISRRIIERHDGMIFAESEEGRGTHIIIELPTLEKMNGSETAPRPDNLERIT